MFNIVIEAYRWFFLRLADFVGLGWGIVALSFITSAAMMPLMKLVAGVVRREAEYQFVILPQLAEIRKRYSSDMDRNFHTQRLYARYGYSPLSAVKKVLPLFVQIPFLLLTYFMLKDTAELQGVSFLFLRDLGQPDGLLKFANVNLLPLAMTLVNLVTVVATPGFTRKDNVQAVSISLLFLLLLYTAPSALLLYWTLNNAITLFRTLVARRGEGARLLITRLRFWASYMQPRMIVSCVVSLLPKATRNFVILEICLFLPGLVAIFATMPDRLDVDVYSDVPMSVSVGFETVDESGGSQIVGETKQGCPIGSHTDPVSFYFADGVPAESLRIRFIGQNLSYDLKTVRLAKNLVLLYDCQVALDGNEARIVGRPSLSGFEIPDVKFAHAGVFASQIFLVLVAFVGCLLKKHRDTGLAWKESIALAVLGGVFLLVVLPGETILMNRDVMDFPLREIFLEMTGCFVVVAVILFAMLLLSSIAFGKAFHLVLLAILVYEYLQTGVLSIGAPSMDGNMDYYWSKTPMLVDFASIVMVGCIFLFLRKSIARRIVTLAVVMLALFGINITISLFSSEKSRPVDAQQSDCPWNMRRAQVAKNIAYSPVGNIIFLVLDSVQSDAAFDVIRADDRLRAEFPGFTAFNNHLGMHDNTHSGTIGMFTGKYHGKGMNVWELAKECYGKDSFVTAYLDDDYPTYLMPGIIGSYSNRIIKKVPPRKSLTAKSIYYRRVRPMNISLVDVIRLKVVPFFLKKWVLQITYLTAHGTDGTFEENSLFPEIVGNEVSREGKTSLLYIHTEGTHAPIRYDANGNRIWTNKDNYLGLCGETHYIMKSVGAYFSELKRRGIYDKSLIVLAADHGCCFDTVHNKILANAPTRAVPMLWIKPVGAVGDIVVCEEPTSHVKLVDLMKRVKDVDLSMPEMIEILRTSKRLFRSGTSDETFKDWYFDERGKLISREEYMRQ